MEPWFSWVLGGREKRGREPKQTLVKPLSRPYLGLIWAPSPSPSRLKRTCAWVSRSPPPPMQID